MPTDRGTSVALLSTMLSFAIIGMASVVYLVFHRLFDAVIHALSVLPH